MCNFWGHLGSSAAVLCSLCDLMFGKASACPGNWPRLTHIHTAYGPSFYVDAGGFILYCHNLQLNLFFFLLLILAFLKHSSCFCSVLFLFSLFALVQQHQFFVWFFWFFLTSKCGSLQHSAGFHSFMQWYLPCKVTLGQIIKQPCLPSPCSDLF